MENRSDHTDQSSRDVQTPAPENQHLPLSVLHQEAVTTPQKQFRLTRKAVVLNGLILLIIVSASLSVSFLRTSKSGQKQWSFQTGSYLTTSPTVANGSVYILSANKDLYALDALSGHEKWVYRANAFIDYSPVVAHGAVYVVDEDNRLYALDALSGHEKWAYRLEATAAYSTSAPVVANGMVYISSGPGRLSALDAVSGSRKWVYQIEDFIQGTPPVVVNGILYINGSSGNVYALDAVSGTERWVYQLADNPDHRVFSSDPTVSNGLVYISSTSGELIVLDALSGHEKWTRSDMCTAPAVVNDLMYVSSCGGRISALDAFSGREKWSSQGTYLSGTPQVANGTIYMYTGTLRPGDDIIEPRDIVLHALDALSGQEKWSYQGLDWFAFSSEVGSSVYIGFNDDPLRGKGTLSALDTSSGKKEWSYWTIGRIGSVPTVGNGIMYISDSSETLYAIFL